MRVIRGPRGDVIAQVALGKLFRSANGATILTGVALEDSVATRDPSDRAHCYFDSRDMLVAAADERGRARQLPGATPRRYHASQMTSSGVSFDSQYDDLYRRQHALAGIPGVGIEAANAELSLLARCRAHGGGLPW